MLFTCGSALCIISVLGPVVHGPELHFPLQVDGDSRVHQSLCAQVLSKITEPRAPGTLVLVVGKDVHSLDEELCGESQPAPPR